MTVGAEDITFRDLVGYGFDGQPTSHHFADIAFLNHTIAMIKLKDFGIIFPTRAWMIFQIVPDKLTKTICSLLRAFHLDLLIIGRFVLPTSFIVFSIAWLTPR